MNFAHFEVLKRLQIYKEIMQKKYKLKKTKLAINVLFYL